MQTPQTSQSSQTPQAESTPKDPPVTNTPTETAPSPINKSLQSSKQINASCNYAAGKAVGGQEINVDLCSIRVKNSQSVAFIYYLNSDQVESEADCSNRTWVTFPERQVNRPQSPATQNMLDTVCGRRNSTSSTTSSAGTAIVFDPPSNVRVSPNGAILCSVQEKTAINIYGSDGSWYKTDVCGSIGFIHADQVRF
ncbi:hypothetical protein [Leptolyngbya sp. DQ-M1]|uniref:hypothetical protein n=1 Tax=Leptolyngbya sp. DQ-M1 TaxID=2933920 RepID=UPI003296F108